MSHGNPADEAIRELLRSARRIAVVGLSPKPWRTSHQIAEFLQECGYRVVPVYPRGDRILGEPVFRSVAEVPEGVDLVDVFRRSEALDEVAVDAVAARAPALWFQLGCVHQGAAARATAAGATVVMDRCILVEHRRLLGSGWRVPS